jgi:hypothetical protein
MQKLALCFQAHARVSGGSSGVRKSKSPQDTTCSTQLKEGLHLQKNRKKEIGAKIKKAKAEATLRSLLRDFGLIQYPLSSILIIIGILGVLRGKEGSRKLFITSLAVGLIALSLALQRSYFTSLGW